MDAGQDAGPEASGETGAEASGETGGNTSTEASGEAIGEAGGGGDANTSTEASGEASGETGGGSGAEGGGEAGAEARRTDAVRGKPSCGYLVVFLPSLCVSKTTPVAQLYLSHLSLPVPLSHCKTKQKQGWFRGR